MAYKRQFMIIGPENGVPAIEHITADERRRLSPIAEFRAVLDDTAAHPETFEHLEEEASVLVRDERGMAERLEKFCAPTSRSKKRQWGGRGNQR